MAILIYAVGGLITALHLCVPLSAAGSIEVRSPDGAIRFRLSAAPRLEYTVSFREKPVIEVSRVGITVDGVNLSEGVESGAVERYQVNETYPWYGAHSTAVDRCNGGRIALRHLKSGVAYTLEVRAWNDGVAFRHVVPGAGTRVPGEATVFRLPAGATLWYHDLEDHYEGAHKRKGLRAVPPGAWAAPPLTFSLPDGGGYASITEGALSGYSGMALEADGSGAFQARLGHAVPASYPFRLRYREDVERLSRPAAVTGTITTPWRVVLAGASLNDLVNSDIIHNVAPPPDRKLFPDGLRTSWIKPGRSLWSYLDGGNNTLEGMKEFARLAAELGFEYNVLEGFWSRWPESQLKELADYSRQRGVGTIIWKHSNSLRDPKAVREFFDLCARTGVAGAKIDFFDHEHQEVIGRYEALLRAAAERKLIVDFHGANKPTGMERTWPNMLGLEGIRGMEMRPPYAQHDATLPFTRMLAGLADYTPMHFGRRMADTNWAHQIANAVILQAPLLVYAAHPANILANPAVELIKAIPSVWDETIVLPGSEIGEVAAFARRKGDDWFVAVINGHYARTLQIDLSFLGSGSYKAMLVRDRDEAAAVKVEHQTVRRNDTLYVQMRSGGGFAGRFIK